ncbi:hypothetical protein DFQ26_009390, partial [Actinomortierella ambigua]
PTTTTAASSAAAVVISSASLLPGSTQPKTKFKDRPLTPEEAALRVLRKGGIGAGMPTVI